MATGGAGGGGLGGLGGAGSAGNADHHKRNTFTSYVAPLPGDMRATADTNEWCLPSDLRDVHLAKPRLLQGEQIVASAPAYMYSSIDPMDSGSGSSSSPADGKSHKEATFGLLSVTNFKLAFVPLHAKRNPAAPLGDLYQENAYLGRNEITLNNIDHIYTIAELGRAASALQAARGMASHGMASHGSRRKKLEPFKQQNISGRIAALHIVCKNFRLLKFAFQQQDSKMFGASDQGKLIASALVRFAYPMRHDLSFAYAHKEQYYSTLGASGTSMYATKNDWARELIRCGATEWQVVSSASVQLLQNPLQAGKYTVPPHFVIPKSCGVDRFLDLSRAFCDSRAAFWVYSYGGSAALVRLAELQPAAQQDTKSENVMLELVRKCDVGRQLNLLQLTDRLPNIQDVLRAYQKLRRLCTPETPEKFMLQDDKYLGLLEKTNWLFYVSLCLRYASEAAATLRSGVTCVLQESNGRDLCCVISSLAQLLLDPHFRTIDGFQSLVQKEWVALEHPFQRRLGHVYPAQPAGGNAELLESEQSPVFLLYLDCVWQLLQQFTDEFEFTQTYLTTLWDACFMPIFDTFQFDTQAQRLKAVRDSQLVLRPVWDWGEQFSDKDKMFFSNPLYQRQRGDLGAQAAAAAHRRSLAVGSKGAHGTGLGSTPSRNTINPQLFATASSVPQDRFLQPAHRIFDLQVWDQCYYRWLPVLDIRGGGQPQVDLFHRLLLSNIAKVQRCIEFQNFDDLPEAFYEATGESRPNQQRDEKPDKEDEAEFVDGVERRRKTTTKAATPTNGLNSVSGNLQLSTLSSFFPFGNPIAGDAPHQLYDILSSSSELLMETSSFLDKSSIV
ncbi:myotubularin-related protein 10-B [Drosophila rhopaloa]|uniref:Myotubularin-related protein 10-B n=1 Tax=Drosophila rhopaloa TaxID=1041015 RepID=A0A6P4F8Z2_DRORH|nr:myotubularin-related protein 10-B [Drosophila rhopaloa]XP_016985543.1 myotubularin-related protein 10-B [Drosophila rhopaloa]XP_016985544.1 myotubularin-related protein 10-B [Drosophila rhopaloa]XP_016985545.1 myotubularin-related protein 10-B [Drosophila rhopaloa]